MNVATDLTAPLARYAERLHAAVGHGHHVASPLGAWLLLALCAPAATGGPREELTAALGLDGQIAAAIAASLLGSRHPLVGSGAAVWTSPKVNAEALAGWMARLPASVERGDLPSRAELDAWAKEHTLGLIEKFPVVERGLETMLVLATTLATKVSWQQSFDVVPARDLGAASPWAGWLTRALRSPAWRASAGADAHAQFIAATGQAGNVAVHTARAWDLAVTSVIAAPDVPPSDVFAAAYDLATAIACGGHVARQSLFDLPLGEGPLWTLTEERIRTPAPDGREEDCTAVLPAWSADSEHDLTNAPGFPAAAAALSGTLGLKTYKYCALQSVLANYSRVGFEAATLASRFVMTCAPPPRRNGILRVAQLRFGHPFAVVAVATDVRHGPWHGVPVFSAWVATPTDAGG